MQQMCQKQPNPDCLSQGQARATISGEVSGKQPMTKSRTDRRNALVNEPGIGEAGAS
jgi:hypothetical protein